MIRRRRHATHSPHFRGVPPLAWVKRRAPLTGRPACAGPPDPGPPAYRGRLRPPPPFDGQGRRKAGAVLRSEDLEAEGRGGRIGPHPGPEKRSPPS